MIDKLSQLPLKSRAEMAQQPRPIASMNVPSQAAGIGCCDGGIPHTADPVTLLETQRSKLDTLFNESTQALINLSGCPLPPEEDVPCANSPADRIRLHNDMIDQITAYLVELNSQIRRL